MLVKCDEPPSRRLLLKMVDLQEELSAVTSRVMSGIAVSEEEWNTVRELSSKLGSTFNDDVDFAWDSDRADVTGQRKTPPRHSMVRFEVEEALGSEAVPVEELSPDAADVV
jgi:hypothetical protein